MFKTRSAMLQGGIGAVMQYRAFRLMGRKRFWGLAHRLCIG